MIPEGRQKKKRINIIGGLGIDISDNIIEEMARRAHKNPNGPDPIPQAENNLDPEVQAERKKEKRRRRCAVLDRDASFSHSEDSENSERDSDLRRQIELRRYGLEGSLGEDSNLDSLDEVSEGNNLGGNPGVPSGWKERHRAKLEECQPRPKKKEKIVRMEEASLGESEGGKGQNDSVSGNQRLHYFSSDDELSVRMGMYEEDAEIRELERSEGVYISPQTNEANHDHLLELSKITKNKELNEVYYQHVSKIHRNALMVLDIAAGPSDQHAARFASLVLPDGLMAELPRGDSEQDYYKQTLQLTVANMVMQAQIKKLLQDRQEMWQRLPRLRGHKEELREYAKPLFSHSVSAVEHTDFWQSASKRHRRTAGEIERRFRCPSMGCDKAYGSEGSLNQHVKLKHPSLFNIMINNGVCPGQSLAT